MIEFIIVFGLFAITIAVLVAIILGLWILVISPKNHCKQMVVAATLVITSFFVVTTVNASPISHTAAQRAITQALKNDHLTTFRTNNMIQVATRRFNGKAVMVLERFRVLDGWSKWERTD